jgi:aerobic carbon-monoxide dehydrogenase small subunit
MKVALTVNGRAVEADVVPRTSLADFLREQLLLTGTHIGCEHGICGACTVVMNGEIARSCITYAVACDGAEISTIEGFDTDALMGRLRQAFTEEHALQCGYCTPGMLVAARDLVRRRQGLSRSQIRTEMSGNLCRCTGYMGIVNAIERVMAQGAVEAQPAAAASSWLGPAPGPQVKAVRTMFPRRAETQVRAPRPPKHTAAPARPPAGKRVTVTVGPVEEKDGLVHLNQSFVLEHPREAVWRLMSDPEAVARCMPGARLDGPPTAGRLSGRIEVKLGPIAASFAGQGTVTAYPAEHRQVIEGQGGDRKSGSLVTGRVDYRLTAADAQGKPATRVDVTIAYGLTGLLAQLGRSALARDLARDMGETFAQNIDAHLRDPAAAPVEGRPLGGFALARRILAARVRALLARVLGR